MKRLLHTLTWLVLILFAAAWIGSTIRVNTDLTEFLPSDDSVISSLVNKQLNEGPASRSLFITITGKPPEELASLSKKMVPLLQNSGFFKYVTNGSSLVSEDDKNWLFENRYLLSPETTKQSFSAENLNTAFNSRLSELRSPVPAMPKEYLPKDPTAAFISLLNQWSGQKKPTKHLNLFFTKDHSTAIIISETLQPGWDVKAQEDVIQWIEDSFDTINTDQALELGISGTGYFAVYSKRHIEAEARLFSIAATVALILFLLLVYRSPRYVLLSAMPLLSAVLAGTLAVITTFSHIHGITLAFGVTILGITIDYPIHVFSHSRGQSKRFWATIYTGAITTIIAFSVFFYTNINGLVELGLFTLSGLAAAVAVTRWLIPLWLSDSPKNQPQTNKLPMSMSLSVIPRVFMVLCLSVFIVFIFSGKKIQWQDDLTALSPLPDSLLQQHQWLLKQLGIYSENRYIIAFKGKAVEEILQKSERLDRILAGAVKDNMIDSHDTPSRYLPSQKTQKQRQLLLPDKESLQQSVATAINGLPFRTGLFQPFILDIERSKHAELLSYESISGPLVKEKLNSHLFKENDNSWTSIIPLAGVHNKAALLNRIGPELDTNTVFVDMKTHTNDMVRSFRLKAGERILIGAALMILSLLINIRNIGRFGRVVFSLGMALTITLSILMLLQVKLSLFHLISLLLVMGIGLDYALFFSLDEKHDFSRKNTLAAITICAVSTITVFGILAFSELYVLRAIGLTTTLGVIAAFFSTFIFAQPLSRAQNKP